MELTTYFILTTVLFLVMTLYFAFHRRVEIEEKIVTEIDPELENQLAGYEHTLRSIAYTAKTIKEARKLADDAIGDEK